MAGRTTLDRVKMEVHPDVRADMREFQTALHRDFNREVGDSDLIGALLAGVPFWQAEQMLRAFKSPDLSGDNPREDKDVEAD